MTDFNKELALVLLESFEEYPVALEEAWQWLGYSTKQKAQKKLEQNFEKDIDYTFNQKVKRVEGNNGGGSTRYNEILMTVDCFKSLGMMAGTEQGKQIRKYFLECEKIAKQKGHELDAVTEMEMIARTATRMAELQRKALEQDRKLQLAETRIDAIEVEQGRYMSPSGTKYTVLGFAIRQGIEISNAVSSQKGKVASRMCKQQGIEIERIYDPRFGHVGLYPESILIEVFKQ